MRAVIINPASASGRTASRWRRIVAALEAGSDEAFEVLLTTRCGEGIELTRRALDDGIRQLVVLGGDGTLGEVVAGCVRPDGTGTYARDIELSIVHQGTGGDLARGLGIPRDEAAAIDVALRGPRRRVDVGVATFAPGPGAQVAGDAAAGGLVRRGFLNTANVGMAAEVVARVTGPLKRLGNNGSFTAATVSCLARNRPRTVRLVADGGLDLTTRVVDVDVCNNRFMGGGMLVAPHALIDDGLFDVVVIGAAGRARLLRTFPKVYSGRHVDDPLVRVHRTSRLEVHAPDEAGAQGVVLDGELVGTTPATFDVLPLAISIRAP